MSDFPKHYTPQDTEKSMQDLWEREKCALPHASTTGKTFYIPIPPPNVTGKLHIGHALMLSLEDIMIRYHRMIGDETIWIPGTDHAGISTQARVEDRLNKQWTPRKQIGREKFLEACKEWVSEYGGHIQWQVARMGASVDWTRERYTFDDKSNALVEKIFIDLYNKWLIYRGEYMVNYSPVLESVISDIEVEHKEVEEKMYYINYFVAGSDKELLVATTRPETLLADQAVAVHPKDKRYKKLIGRSVILPIVNKEIPIIADEMVDMDFGTGVVKITPAHDPADFETAKRHNLRMDYRVIDRNGMMTKEAGIFAGLLASGEGRSNIVELLRSKGNLVKVEPYTHKVGFCERSKCRIESVVSTQWFVSASVMAEKVIIGYKKKDFEIIPERFNKTFEDWIYNLRDWCISRQLWWGHQIPAYFDTNTGELLGVTSDPSEIYRKQCEKYHLPINTLTLQSLKASQKRRNSDEVWPPQWIVSGNTTNEEAEHWIRSSSFSEAFMKRDEDVLDTWFSSALWPFSVLDWDFETPSEFFEKFYPADVLETGHDILFFWVIRMFLMGYEYTGQSPFKKVYLHGLVLNEDGKKMSKSAGTVIDPLSIIDKYSTDALRLALVLGNTPGNNLNFSIKDVEEYGFFLNKLWNIVRFSWMNVGDINEDRTVIEERIKTHEQHLLPYERWILSRLSSITKKMTAGMEEYSFSSSGLELLAFIRDEFADFAIEAYKIEKDMSIVGKDVMKLCILDILGLLHPYAPHITEKLYGSVTGWRILMMSTWPVSTIDSEKSSEELMTRVFDIVRIIRNIRAESKVPAGELRDIMIITPEVYRSGIEINARIIAWLGRWSSIEVGKKPPKWSGYAYGVIHGIDIYVDARIDASKIEEERARLESQIEEKRFYLRTLSTKLQNNAFIANAPEKIVRVEMEKKNQAETELKKLEEKYHTLTTEID